jgi:hypothetical protein
VAACAEGELARGVRLAAMTPRDLIDLAGAHPAVLCAVLLAVPMIAAVVGLMHQPGAGGRAPWSWTYALLVYAACVPGVGAAVVTGYTLFFTHENLLDKDVLVYFLPIVSMVATLVLVRRAVPFDEVPGFDRLSGLMVAIAVTFGLVLALRRTFIGIVFVGSLARLAVFGAALIALLQWGLRAAFRRPSDRREPPPAFPPA